MNRPVFADLVRTFTTSEGTGAIVPGAPVEGHRGFAGAVGVGERFHYCIAGITVPGEWEVGGGVMQADGSIARGAIASSAGGAAVDLSPGVKTIALTVASAWYEALAALPEAVNALAAGKADLSGARFEGAVRAPELSLETPLGIASGGTGASAATGSGMPVLAEAPTLAGATLAGARLEGDTMLSGGRIAFPAAWRASADPNTLDDYAEGVFAPALRFGGSSAGMIADGFGRYLKIGSAVFFELRVSLSAKGGATGTATVAGLPFASEATPGSGTIGAVLPFDLVGIASLATSVGSGATAVSLWNVSGGTSTALTHANFTNNSQIYVSGFYRVDLGGDSGDIPAP